MVDTIMDIFDGFYGFWVQTVPWVMRVQVVKVLYMVDHSHFCVAFDDYIISLVFINGCGKSFDLIFCFLDHFLYIFEFLIDEFSLRMGQQFPLILYLILQ